jgi:hypothetical protein
MRPILFLALVCLILTPAARAVSTPDPILLNGLRDIESNGLEAGLRTWYSDRLGLATETRDKLFPITRDLGDVIDTEVVNIQVISKRVTRYYVAIYYTRCPVWIRIERYSSRDRSFYLPLKFSLNPDDILPGYVTEFTQ